MRCSSFLPPPHPLDSISSISTSPLETRRRSLQVKEEPRRYMFSSIPRPITSDNSPEPMSSSLIAEFRLSKTMVNLGKRAESDALVPDAPARPEKFVQRYTEILEDLKKDLESHCGPPDCILLCRLREQVLRELGFQDIFKKVKDEENAKAMSLFENVVDLNEILMMLLKMKSSGMLLKTNLYMPT